LNKLLRVTIINSLKWDDHITAVTPKTAKRLWFLKKLKRAGVSQTNVVYFNQAVIQPVLEYACPVCITGQQSKQLESIERRAYQIILNDMKYSDACIFIGLPCLHDMRHELSHNLFR